MPRIIVIPAKPIEKEPNGFAAEVDLREWRKCVAPRCGEPFLGNYDRCPKHRNKPKGERNKKHYRETRGKR